MGGVLKRALDLVVSLIGLAVLAVPFLLVAAAIRFDSPGPALFRQERTGYRGAPFLVWKFRTMRTGAESESRGAFTTAGDPRITRVGAVLRRVGLDELPQLINVLRGEMSLVGPRPTLPYQVERYNDRQRRRLLAKPGLTGWALIKGRNSLTWPEKIDLDLWYVDHWSFWLDLRILVVTPFVVVSGKGLFLESTDEILGKGG